VKPTNNRRWGIRLTAAAGAAVLAAFAFGSPAMGAPVTPSFGDIDTTQAGSITLHKHEYQSGTGALKDANPLDPVAGQLPNPIAGVTFTAYRLSNFSVSDPADWDKLAAQTAAPIPADACASPALSGWTLGAGTAFPATDGNGIATLAIPAANLGAYLICETDEGTNNIESPSAPFVVTVPYPDTTRAGATNGWVYDVNAYPKNTLAPEISKTVDPQASLGLGSTVSYPTTTGIPRVPDADQFTRYTVVDPMDPRLSDTDVTGVTVGGVAVDAALYSVVRDRNVLMVQFNQAGLAWLRTQGGKDLVVTFEGTVSSLESPGFGLADGVVYNKAYLVTEHAPLTTPPTTPELPPLTPPGDNPDEPVDPGNPFDPEDPRYPDIPPTPSNEVKSNWGDITLWKFDEQAADHNAAGSGLSGAEFQVFPAAVANPEAGAQCGTEIAENATAIEVGGSDVFSSADGHVSIPGLFVSDSENAPVNAATRCYVVKETKAPAGYVLPGGDAALHAVAVKIGQSSTVAADTDAQIPNSKQLIPGLPLTGSDGKVLAMIVGAALMLIAVGTVVVSRFRKTRTS